MNARTLESIRAILQKLIADCGFKPYYFKHDIDRAIMAIRGVDKRTINAWWNALWNLRIIEQPKRGSYCLNMQKLSLLDPNQKRLAEFEVQQQ